VIEFFGDEIMGEVAIIYRIMPVDKDVDLKGIIDKIREASKGIAKLQGMQEKPVAFGINALLIRIVIEDKEGGPEEIEKALSGITGVQSVEAMEMTRLL
jgi:elongation factor 1-beta